MNDDNPAPPPSRARRNGRWLVPLMLVVLVGGTFALTWFAVHHPKTRQFDHGEFYRFARVTEILGPATFRADLPQTSVTVRLLGIRSPLELRDQLSEALDPDQEARVAAGVLRTWIYKRPLKLVPEPEEAERDEQDRLLVYAELYGVDVGKKLVEEGQAGAVNSGHPRAALYRQARAEARAAGKGIWR